MPPARCGGLCITWIRSWRVVFWMIMGRLAAFGLLSMTCGPGMIFPGGRDMARITFEGLPERFLVSHWHGENGLASWLPPRCMRAVNQSNHREGLPANTKRIILREGYFGDVSPNEEMGPVIRRVTLRAKVLSTAWQLVGGALRRVATEIRIMPHTREDERLIARHCEEMAR